MRVLAAMGIFKEVEHDTFAPTPLADAYVTGSPLAVGVIHLFVDVALLPETHVTNASNSGPSKLPFFPGSQSTSRKEALVIPATHSTAHSSTPWEPSLTSFTGFNHIHKIRRPLIP